MNFKEHYKLEGMHAAFSPSSSAWLRYSDDKLLDIYSNSQAAQMGSRLHAWAKETIDLGIKQPRSKKTLYSFVNDAIGFKMSTEVVLYYSDRFFGTTDAICYRDGILRIHDLKTGKTTVHMEQLAIYAALFCLEYKMDPKEIFFELRIYQNDDILVSNPEYKEIQEIMDKIVHFDNLLKQYDERN